MVVIGSPLSSKSTLPVSSSSVAIKPGTASPVVPRVNVPALPVSDPAHCDMDGGLMVTDTESSARALPGLARPEVPRAVTVVAVPSKSLGFTMVVAGQETWTVGATHN